MKGSRANLISIKTKEAGPYRYRRRRDVSHRTPRYRVQRIHIRAYIRVYKSTSSPCLFNPSPLSLSLFITLHRRFNIFKLALR